MFLSINWLRDYLAKPDAKIELKDLSDRLTMRGIPVAAVRRSSLGLERVVVGKIEKIEKHPDAERLQIARVLVSSDPNETPVQIVCGASNIAEGDFVPVALPGAILPGDIQIKASAIRGVESHGMICSGKELALSSDSEGILQLSKHSTIGQPLSRLLGSDDAVMEFDLTPNRGDCLSIVGLAREIAPILGTHLRPPKEGKFKITSHKTSSIVKVEIEDSEACPRYVARVIDGLRVTESPDWIKQRLQSVGLTPVNNIVDITNFVMMEYGQPLHAFDLRKIQSGVIRIARCKASSQMTLLNDESIELQPADILILDGERPVALAGIMGSANSHIQEDTTSILLESACFDAKQIRRTSIRLGISTESSKRFEKGIDVVGVGIASERAASLMRDTFNANVYHPPIDTNEFPSNDTPLSVDLRDLRRLSGMKIAAEQCSEVLGTIEISSFKKSPNVLSVRVPSFRKDLVESVDIVEEVARLVGYDNIPESYPLTSATYDRWDETQHEFEMRVKTILSQSGLRETIHYSFLSEETLHQYGYLSDNAVKLKNPISEEMKILRTGLLPSLLETYKLNKNRKIWNQRLFEVAKVYTIDDQQETQVKETPMVAGLLSGSRTQVSWRGPDQPVDFFLGKGVVDSLTRQITTVYLVYEHPKNHKLIHPSRGAIVKLGHREVGIVGELHPFIRSSILETSEPLVIFELNLESLKKYERTHTRFKSPSKYPGIELDIAVLVDTGVSGQTLLEAIKIHGGTLLTEVMLFDIYEGNNLPPNKKSLAFHLTFCSPDRTLLDEEINPIRDRILATLAEKHGAVLRS